MSATTMTCITWEQVLKKTLLVGQKRAREKPLYTNDTTSQQE